MPRTKQFDEKEVLGKAVELFWTKGFHATSMQDLVTHLGINRASLYDTFGSKEALFDMAFKHYRVTEGQKMQQLITKSTSVKAGFRALFEMAIAESVSDRNCKGCFVVNTTTELLPGDNKIHQMLKENKQNAQAVFTQRVQEGIDSGELQTSKSAESIGLMLFTLYNGFRVLAKVEANPQQLRQIMETGLSVLD
ncbi:MAG: TetR/AcrR family transcriptional regulator [Bacteroidota bacterium]